MGKSLELFWNFDKIFVENLLLGNFGIGEFECQFFKILLGNPVGNVPAQVNWENFVSHVGSVFWKIFLWANLFGTLVRFLKILTWENFYLGFCWTSWKFHLGNTWWNFGESFNLEKFKIWNFLFGKRVFLSMSVEQNFGKIFTWEIFSPCWQCLTWEFFVWEKFI